MFYTTITQVGIIVISIISHVHKTKQKKDFDSLNSWGVHGINSRSMMTLLNVFESMKTTKFEVAIITNFIYILKIKDRFSDRFFHFRNQFF